MRNARILMLGVLVIALAFGCKKETTQSSDPSLGNTSTMKSTPSQVVLYAGQDLPVGYVEFTELDQNNDGASDAVKVCYNITVANWYLSQIHFDIETSAALIPHSKQGNPIPGQFKYAFNDLAGLTSYCFTVPFDNNIKCATILAAAAHASVYNDVTLATNSAWGDGTRFVKSAWGMWFNVNFSCNPPVDECKNQYETAFGGNSIGAGKAWWYYFDVAKGSPQNIYAGQTLPAGTVTISDADANGMRNITISLANGYTLDPAASESVKIQGYDAVLASRPAAGKFTTYKGTSLSVNVPSSLYYIVHLDVVKCMPI